MQRTVTGCLSNSPFRGVAEFEVEAALLHALDEALLHQFGECTGSGVFADPTQLSRSPACTFSLIRFQSLMDPLPVANLSLRNEWRTQIPVLFF